MIPPVLREKQFAFLVSSPENFGHSNGTRVFLDAARIAKDLGLDACIVPAHTSQALYTSLPAPYSDLPIRWEVPSGCCAVIGDTLTPERLQQARDRANHICHYTLAPLGIFQGDEHLGNHIDVYPGERQAVYSSQVSTRLPTFYLQSHFQELEPWIERSLSRAQKGGKRRTGYHLKACIYAGKGYLSPIHPALRQRIKRTKSFLITRLRPASKNKLYALLAKSEMLVSFDPLSSLAYEASLLGVPVFVPCHWDEPNFIQQFPVRLDGVIWDDLDAFLALLHDGFDHLSVVRSYREALARNPRTLVELLSYAAGLTPQHEFCASEINNYWHERQAFFQAINLPSRLSEWGPLSRAMPPSTALERVHDVVLKVDTRFFSLRNKFIALSRAAGRRLISIKLP